MMGCARRANGIDRDPEAAIGTVLEADRARQARRELAVHLALGRARPDRTPRDEIADVLRRDHIEELAAGGQTAFVQLEEEPPRDAQPVIDAKAAVELRIVDEAFPPDG